MSVSEESGKTNLENALLLTENQQLPEIRQLKGNLGTLVENNTNAHSIRYEALGVQ